MFHLLCLFVGTFIQKLLDELDFNCGSDSDIFQTFIHDVPCAEKFSLSSFTEVPPHTLDILDFIHSSLVPSDVSR